MLNSEFYKIIDEDLIEVYIPKSSHFSLGTSPYFAHQNGLAIDIYHELSLDNYNALSPVNGRIIKCKELIAPRPKFSDGINKEYLTIIQGKNTQKVFKILHVKPQIKVGEEIKVGDVIGTTIKNGYFAPWSSPHIHLEIRPRNDMIRASGGEIFSLFYDNSSLSKEHSTFDDINQEFIPLIIKSTLREFILAHLPNDLYYKISPYIGVKGNLLDKNCILDGGIPLYNKGIVLLDNDAQLRNFSLSVMNDKKIGNVWNQRGRLGMIKYDPVKFYLNSKPIRGISLFLANFIPLIKIIPYDLKGLNYEENSTQRLTIQN